jgi:hypothetical protein
MEKCPIRCLVLTVSGPLRLNVRNDPDQHFKYTTNYRILQEQVEARSP